MSDRVHVIQQNTGHWAFFRVGNEQTEPVGGYTSRQAAVVAAGAEFPGLPIIADGETSHAAPPPLPRISPREEAERAGVPGVPLRG